MIINENYKIEAPNPLNVILYQKSESKKKEDAEEITDDEVKEPGWRFVGAYATVQQALRALVTKEINSTGLEYFQTVVKKVNELFALIENLDTETIEKLERENRELKAQLKANNKESDTKSSEEEEE